ncbi:MAG: hypothetical protein ISS91_03745 [Candidatus Omnitrophica bacterium]|nr:hypothetical protein [Candidatus Omnitrophota bacterium]
MKKIIIFALVVLILSASYGFAQDRGQAFTNGYLNGRVVLGSTGETDANYVDGYALGIIDALYITNFSQMEELYPRHTRVDIVKAMRAYYRNNPAKTFRPIADVVWGGCK